MVPHLVSLLALALAVSLDGFGVGAMYGLRKIKIPVFSVLIIAAMSGLVFFAAMQIGVAVTAYIPASAAKTAGAVILIGLGFWAVIQMRRNAEEEEAEETQASADAARTISGGRREQLKNNGQEARVLSIELRRLGLVIQILRTPSAADLDRSGVISAMEAAWLGLALSLDAFGAGIGAAFIGYTPMLTSAVIAVASGSFILGGLRFGFMYSNVQWIRKLSVLPGCILMLMGLFRLM